AAVSDTRSHAKVCTPCETLHGCLSHGIDRKASRMGKQEILRPSSPPELDS
ncbi:hypothetical protein PAXRUDRAFT_735109, partial [Paxillus rubicundulus Ve08.2h10]